MEGKGRRGCDGGNEPIRLGRGLGEEGVEAGAANGEETAGRECEYCACNTDIVTVAAHRVR
jgi:hypothetical protein